MHLSLTWPQAAGDGFREDFFAGGWHPTESIIVTSSPPPSSVDPVVIEGPNWFLLGNAVRCQGERRALVHCARREAGRAGYAFRGYLLDPPICSWSPAEAIEAYWESAGRARHNGVFAGVRVLDRGGGALELVSDAFGIGPLYYRRIGDGVLFATSPRFLAMPGDQPDLLAWRCLLQAWYVSSNRSLSVGISRVPPGTILRFRKGSVEEYRWFDYGQVANGTERLTVKAAHEIEEALGSAVLRCMRLPLQDAVLPLSSGYDSRRILAVLLDRQVPFQALTVRTYLKGHRDLDARFASQMAADYGFRHRVIDIPEPEEFIECDRHRRLLVDAESPLHSVFMTLRRWLPPATTLVFDGLGGDVFGGTGFLDRLRVPELPEREQLSWIAGSGIDDKWDNILNPGYWPSPQEVRNDIVAHLRELPPGGARGDLAATLLRARRTIAPWSQWLLPAGHVAVYPYFDLEYLRTICRYDPVERHRTTAQDICLRVLHPKLHAYPGTRAVPEHLPAEGQSILKTLDLACMRTLYDEVSVAHGHDYIGTLLSWRARSLFSVARQTASPKAASVVSFRTRWWLRPFLELASRQARLRGCWRIASDACEAARPTSLSSIANRIPLRG